MKTGPFLLTMILALLPLGMSRSLAQPGWSLQSSPLGSDPLGKVQFANTTEGWIAANSGLVLHTTNAGMDWVVQDPEPVDEVEFLSVPAIGLSFINATTGWVIGIIGRLSNPSGAALYSTTTGGNNWSRQDLDPWTNGLGVQFVDESHGWVSVATGSFPNLTTAVLHTLDGGNTWSSVFTAERKVGFFSFVDQDNGWMIVDSLDVIGDFIPPLEIFHTTNGGATWTSQLLENTGDGYTDVHFRDLNNGWVIGNSRKLLHTTNGGSTWTSLGNTGLPNWDGGGLFVLNANTIWFGVHGQQLLDSPLILHSTNGGTTWSNQDPAVNNTVSSTFFVDENTGWLSADFGGIAHYSEPTSVGDDESLGKPYAMSLHQNYPNPFNPNTTIEYALPEPGHVTIKIFNALGQEVRTLVEGFEEAGYKSAVWNGKGNAGEPVAGGAYFYTLKTAESFIVHTMMLVK